MAKPHPFTPELKEPITIHGLPADTVRFKLRLRQEEISMVFVKRSNGVMTQYGLQYDAARDRFYINDDCKMATNITRKPQLKPDEMIGMGRGPAK